MSVVLVGRMNLLTVDDKSSCSMFDGDETYTLETRRDQ